MDMHMILLDGYGNDSLVDFKCMENGVRFCTNISEAISASRLGIALHFQYDILYSTRNPLLHSAE